MVYLPPQPLLHAGHPMTRQTPIQVSLLAGVLIWTGAMGQPGEAFGADPKTPGMGTSWGDYMTAGKVIAEVRSSDGDSLKMRVYWNTVTQGKTGTSSRGRRPSLGGHHGHTAQTPLTIARAAAPSMTSTTSPLETSVRNGTEAPLILAAVAWSPTSLWTA